MVNTAHESYDAIIIGAGISGLVCGCYLAKAGMKVLIAEQHFKPGGYCTSFRRKNFLFDAAAHSFGSYRKDGNMYKVIKGLNLEKKIKIHRYTPSDVVISPDYKITFWGDINRTKRELQRTFPSEANGINRFFDDLVFSKPIDFAALRKTTFSEFLNKYFADKKLKAILAVPTLGNGALPPSLISAFTGVKIFSEFVLDGGYYPRGSMQRLPDILVDRFTELGGILQLACSVKRIRIENNVARGVVLDKYGIIKAKYVISACDARETFYKLVGKKSIRRDILETIKSMTPSLSTFILYLGIDKPFESLPKAGTNLWFLPDYDLEKAYFFLKRGELDRAKGFMVRFSPDRKTLLAFTNAPFKSKTYWDTNKEKTTRSFIRRIEKYAIPNLSKHIVFKEAATPYTLYRYTLNYKGAAYGWASFPSQLFTPELRQATCIKGLYLTGHWTTHTQGIPGVAYLGYSTAKLILRKENLN